MTLFLRHLQWQQDNISNQENMGFATLIKKGCSGLPPALAPAAIYFLQDPKRSEFVIRGNDVIYCCLHPAVLHSGVTHFHVQAYMPDIASPCREWNFLRHALLHCKTDESFWTHLSCTPSCITSSYSYDRRLPIQQRQQ
jgi:hypothetical protein